MANLKFGSYRVDAIKRNLRYVDIKPLDVMITGATGAGKSTTLNTIFQTTLAKVGDGVDPETMEVTGYKLNDVFRLWDTPGLGDGVDIDKKHGEKILDLLHDNSFYDETGLIAFIDMCLVIVDGSNRDMGTTYKLINEILVPNINLDVGVNTIVDIYNNIDIKRDDVVVPNIEPNRVFVAINQADMAMKGYHWDKENNIPDSTLAAYLEEQALSVKRRIKEATGLNVIKPVCYSAKYGWNLESVFDMLIDNIPQERPLTYMSRFQEQSHRQFEEFNRCSQRCVEWWREQGW